MKAIFLSFFTLVLIATIYMVEANLVLKSNGKKHKDIIVLGKKCEPTIIKSSDKKGKHGQTLIMNPECHEKKYEIIPMPVLYQDYPMYEQSYGGGYGMTGYHNGYGGGSSYGMGGYSYGGGGYGSSAGYTGGYGVEEKSYYPEEGYYH